MPRQRRRRLVEGKLRVPLCIGKPHWPAIASSSVDLPTPFSKRDRAAGIGAFLLRWSLNA